MSFSLVEGRENLEQRFLLIELPDAFNVIADFSIDRMQGLSERESLRACLRVKKAPQNAETTSTGHPHLDETTAISSYSGNTCKVGKTTPEKLHSACL